MLQPMEEGHCNSPESVIRGAAFRGARSVTSRKQVVVDAVCFAVERWEDAVMAGKSVSNWQAWAFTVAANAARKLSSKQTAPVTPVARTGPGGLIRSLVGVHEATHAAGASTTRTRCSPSPELLRAYLAKWRHLFRGRQIEVLLKLAEANMSLHRAAKELGMRRYSVQRAFKSALRRLQRTRK